MARKKRGSGGRATTPARREVIADVSLAETTRERYLNYALSVITSRALPDVRDGLKPVQRRILYALWHDQRALADSRYVKSAAVVGDVLGKYHPHSGEAAYDALVRMAQPFTLRYPLIEGYGNFGSLDGDPPAAMRYTECRLMPIAHELLQELRDQTVPFRANYANTTTEPVVLPSRIPHLLINGIAGIAVGMATNIPPHNLKEVCNALVALLDKDRDLPVEKLLKSIKGPDFPTGGVILNTQDELRHIYATGQGTIKLRGTCERDPKTPDRIVITSVPYGVEKDALVQRIGDLIARGQVPQLVNVKDLSTDDVRVVLELRPGSNPDAVLAYLYKNTALQTNFSVNLTCLTPAEGAEVPVPARLDLKSILIHFLDFRLEVVTRRLTNELEALRRRIHVLEGFAIIFDNLDEAIRIIRNSDGKADAAPRLIKRFELSEEQADAILETKLYRLGKLEIKDILGELKQKRARAKEIERLLGDESARWGLVRSEIQQVTKAYGDPRRTKIEGPDEDVSYKEEDYIIDEDAWVIVTKDGWLKRQKSFADVASIRVRDEDAIGWVYRARAKQTITFVTDRGIAYTLRVNDIPQTTGHGEPIHRLFSFEDGETIVGVLCHDPRCLPEPPKDSKAKRNGANGSAQGFLSDDFAPSEGNGNGQAVKSPPPYAVAVTAAGKVLRFSFSQVAPVSTRKGRQIVRLESGFTGDRVLGVEATEGSENLCVVTAKARLLLFPIREANVVSGLAKGVTAIRLDAKGNDRALAFRLIRHGSETIDVRTNRGAVQSIRASKYPVASRGGKGYAVMQRGSFEEWLRPGPVPVPPPEEIDEI